MSLSREVLKWLQSLDLSRPIKTPKRDLSNGFSVAEVFSCYYPNDISMHSFENGQSIQRKVSNWAVLQKFFRKKGVCPGITENIINDVIQMRDDKSAFILIEEMYQFLTNKKCVQSRVIAQSKSPSTARGPSYAKPTANNLLRDKISGHEGDGVSSSTKAHQIIQEHVQNIKKERVIDPKYTKLVPGAEKPKSVEKEKKAAEKEKKENGETKGKPKKKTWAFKAKELKGIPASSPILQELALSIKMTLNQTPSGIDIRKSLPLNKHLVSGFIAELPRLPLDLAARVFEGFQALAISDALNSSEEELFYLFLICLLMMKALRFQGCSELISFLSQVGQENETGTKTLYKYFSQRVLTPMINFVASAPYERGILFQLLPAFSSDDNSLLQNLGVCSNLLTDSDNTQVFAMAVHLIFVETPSRLPQYRLDFALKHCQHQNQATATYAFAILYDLIQNGFGSLVKPHMGSFETALGISSMKNLQQPKASHEDPSIFSPFSSFPLIVSEIFHPHSNDNPNLDMEDIVIESTRDHNETEQIDKHTDLVDNTESHGQQIDTVDDTENPDSEKVEILDALSSMFTDFKKISLSTSPPLPVKSKITGKGKKGTHLHVFVHGLAGNPLDFRLLQAHFRVFFNAAGLENFYFLSCQSCVSSTLEDIEQLGANIAAEVNEYILTKLPLSTYVEKLSFFGHSLGGVIIRSAISHRLLRRYRRSFHALVTFSSPHLGTNFSKSKIIMYAMKIWRILKDSQSLKQLALLDNNTPGEDIGPQHQFLQALSAKKNINSFKYVLLISSEQDLYVPFYSSRVQHPNVKKILNGKKCSQKIARMIEKINTTFAASHSSTEKLLRLNICFDKSELTNQSYLDFLLGRAAHIRLLDSHNWLDMFFVLFHKYLV